MTQLDWDCSVDVPVIKHANPKKVDLKLLILPEPQINFIFHNSLKRRIRQKIGWEEHNRDNKDKKSTKDKAHQP